MESQQQQQNPQQEEEQPESQQDEESQEEPSDQQDEESQEDAEQSEKQEEVHTEQQQQKHRNAPLFELSPDFLERFKRKQGENRHLLHAQLVHEMDACYGEMFAFFMKEFSAQTVFTTTKATTVGNDQQSDSGDGSNLQTAQNVSSNKASTPTTAASLRERLASVDSNATIVDDETNYSDPKKEQSIEQQQTDNFDTNANKLTDNTATASSSTAKKRSLIETITIDEEDAKESKKQQKVNTTPPKPVEVGNNNSVGKKRALNNNPSPRTPISSVKRSRRLNALSGAPKPPSFSKSPALLPTPRRKPKRLADYSFVGKVVTVSAVCTEEGCDLVCPNIQTLYKHQEEMHNLTKYRCYQCKELPSFPSRVQLNAHLAQAHADAKSWHCVKCTEMFRGHDVLHFHFVACHHDGHFKCACCEFTASSRFDVIKHYNRIHHGPPPPPSTTKNSANEAIKPEPWASPAPNFGQFVTPQWQSPHWPPPPSFFSEYPGPGSQPFGQPPPPSGHSPHSGPFQSTYF